MPRGFSVALLGGDGAGKTTVGRRLTEELAARITYIYMGINPSSSSHQLPTTRLVNRIRGRTSGRRPDEGGGAIARRGGGHWGALRTASTPLRLAHRLAEEWYRQVIAWRSMLRGRIVLYDRHFFFDYYATDIDRSRNRSMSRRIHGWVLEHVYPRPDLVIYLDAPPEVLFARKGEGTLESLATRRSDYRAFRGTLRHFLEVDATQPIDAVVDQVKAAIDHFEEHGSIPASGTS